MRRPIREFHWSSNRTSTWSLLLPCPVLNTHVLLRHRPRRLEQTPCLLSTNLTAVTARARVSAIRLPAAQEVEAARVAVALIARRAAALRMQPMLSSSAPWLLSGSAYPVSPTSGASHAWRSSADL